MRRGIFLLIGALLLGGLATWLTAAWLDRAAVAKGSPTGSAQQTVRILVAGTDLKPGDTLTHSMTVWQAWPLTAVRPEHLVEGAPTAASYAGAMVRTSVPTGEPLMAAHLVKRGDQGIMAALIAPGHRAVSIAVTASSGIAGFVGPGDRVDILLTATLSGNSGNRIVGQTVVHNARVLGIDQRVDPLSVAASQGAADLAPPATVTLEVTAKQAEAIAVAQELGRLSLSLRDLKAQQADYRVGDDSGKTWDTDVTRLPASAFASSAEAMGAGLASSLPVASTPLFPGLPPVADGPGASAASGGVEQVNGVEIVRGSSTRTSAAGPPSEAPAVAPPAAAR